MPTAPSSRPNQAERSSRMVAIGRGLSDLADDRYDAPTAAGLDVLIRGLSLTSGSDHDTLAVTDQIFDGLYEHTGRQLITGRPPA